MKKQIFTLLFLLVIMSPVVQGQQRGQIVGEPIPYPALSVEETQDLINNLSPLELPDFILNLLSDIDFAIQGFKVKYRTVDFKGNPTVASGLVVVPITSCPKDMMVYCHGTVFAKDQVPSNLSGAAGGLEIIFGLLYGGNGYLTVMPDYLGLGDSPDFHLYVDEKTEASATIDLMIAAKRLAQINSLNFTNKVHVSGYSQGGHGGMSAFRLLQRARGAGFKVLGAGLGSGPYDLAGVQYDFIADDPFYARPEFILYVIASCQEANGNIYNTPGDIIKPEFVQDYIDNILGQTGDLSWVVSPYTEMLTEEFYLDLRDNPNNPVRQCLLASDVANWDNRLPTTMYYCTLDEEVTFQNALVAEQQFEKRLPWYLFWFRALINSTDLGAKNHGDCVTPYTLVSKLRFDLRQTSCNVWNTKRSSSSGVADNGRLLTRPINYNYLEISTSGLAAPVERVSLLTFDGTTAASFSDFGKSKEELIRIDVRDLERAPYVVRITDAQGTSVDELTTLEPVQLLMHKEYHPLTYQADEALYELDLSLLPEPVQSLLIYDREGQFIRKIDGRGATELLSFPAEGLSFGTHTLEVQTARNSFFLELAGGSLTPGAASLSVFPNPMKGSTTIRVSGTELIESAGLFDAQGRLVWKRENIKEREIRPSISLPAGIYQLRVTTTSGDMLVERLVIQ